MKVQIDDNRCRGHGMCCTLCPQVFEVTNEGFAVALVPEVPPEFRDAVSQAVEQCPERAISIQE